MTESDRIAGDVPMTSAEEAAELVPMDGTVAMSSLGGGPKEVPKHLNSEAGEGSLTLLGTADTGMVADYTLIDEVDLRYPFAVWEPVKRAINEERMRFVDTHLSQVGDEVRQRYYGDVDVAVIEAVRVTEDGFVPSTVVGATPDYVEAADSVVLEVNHGQPKELEKLHDVYRRPRADAVPLDDPAGRLGGNEIPFDGKLAAVVETDVEPPGYPFRDLTDAERTVVERFGEFVSRELERNPAFDDRVCFEMGVGSLGDAAAEALQDVDFDGLKPYYYAEVVQDAVLDLLREDVFEGASAMAMVLSEQAKRRAFDEVDELADDLVLRSLSVSNDPDLIRRFDVVAVNTAVEVDVYGNVNSSHVAGTRLLQGIGGSGDYSRHSLVSVFVLRSRIPDKDVSTIVPFASHVDHTEHDVDVVITEQGVADLRGKAPRDRAETLVERCAHPEYRDELRAYIDGGEPGHVPHDLPSCFTWRSS